MDRPYCHQSPADLVVDHMVDDLDHLCDPLVDQLFYRAAAASQLKKFCAPLRAKESCDDDLIVVIIDCSPESATFIHLIVELLLVIPVIFTVEIRSPPHRSILSLRSASRPKSSR